MNAWSPGSTVDDYRLLDRLGEGGAGAVWRVEHLPTGAQRALKVMLLGDTEGLQRFRREAEALAAVEHPNVARVHTVGEFAGRPYLVLDLAAGGDLATRLKQGPLPPEDARRLALELADGLAEVHAHGLLHRDLKPSNVLFDEHGRPLLVDFGLARRIDGSSLTQTGALLGTPSYMAPEQAEGSKRLDERTDVYGLGALLYHALTGEPPFRGSSTLAVLRAVLDEAPRPPHELNPAVPRDLSAACLGALAKQRMNRPRSAQAFAATLAPATPPPGRAPRRAAALALLLALGAAGALAVVASTRAARAEPDLAPPTEPPPLAGAPLEPPDARPSHELDAVLGKLPPVTADDLDGFHWGLLSDEEGLLAATRAGELEHVYTWLVDRKQHLLAGALLYQVATRGQALTDPGPRRDSQAGWVTLGVALEGGNPFLSDLLWTPKAWAQVRDEVVNECYRRGAQGGRPEGALHLGRRCMDSGPTPNPAEALRWLREVHRLPVDRPGDLPTAWLHLAQLTLDHPTLEGALTLEEALARAEEVERAIAPAEQARVQALIDALKRRLATAPHPLDRALRALPALAPADLEGFAWSPLYGTAEELLAATNPNALQQAYKWLLREERLEQAAALLYTVAVRGREQANEVTRRLSQEAWFTLGSRLLQHEALRRALFDDATWEQVKAKVVLECFRRAAQAGRSDGWVARANLYLGYGAEALGLVPDPAEAQRCYAAALEVPGLDPQDATVAKLRLASLAWEHPALPDRLSDELALGYAEEALGSTKEPFKRAEAERAVAGLKARLARAAGEGE